MWPREMKSNRASEPAEMPDLRRPRSVDRAELVGWDYWADCEASQTLVAVPCVVDDSRSAGREACDG